MTYEEGGVHHLKVSTAWQTIYGLLDWQTVKIFVNPILHTYCTVWLMLLTILQVST